MGREGKVETGGILRARLVSSGILERRHDIHLEEKSVHSSLQGGREKATASFRNSAHLKYCTCYSQETL